MENKDYRIVESDTMIQDYNDVTTPIFKHLKIGILGTTLLCSSPSIYAKESVYSINKEAIETSIDEVYDYGKQIDTLINTVNELNKVKYTKKDVFDSILSFKSLINRWDGYDSLPLEVKSASNAISLINSFSNELIGRMEDFYPNPHGTISFEWGNSYKEKVYVEVGNNSFSYFVKFNSLKPLFFDNLEFSDENIQELAKHIKAV